MASAVPVAYEEAIQLPSLEEAERDRQVQDQLQLVADRLMKLADDQVRKKAPVERRWIEDERAYHGRYEPSVEAQLAEAEKSRAFVKITRKKTNSWEARLSALLFPTDEENWGISPTPLPTLAEAAKQANELAQQSLEQANVAAETGGMAQAMPQVQQAEQAFNAAAELEQQMAEAIRRCDAMRKEIKDQLVECGYAAECRMMIRDACRLGTGIMKGPLAGDRKRGQWIALEDGTYTYTRGDDPAPIYRWVDPYAYFPDMSALRPEDREFEFERHLWSAKDLRALVRDRNFNATAVRDLLTEDRRYRQLTDQGMSYLTNLRSITGSTEAITGRYIGWEYHGPLETREVSAILRALGNVEAADRYEMIDDPLQEVKVIVFLCEGKILKISPCYPLDSEESLYSIFTFERAEGSIFGYGIPHIMADSQASMNGAWRMALDNAALSVGPQIFIDKEAIEPANRRWKLEPRKLWYKKKGVGLSGEPMQAIHIPNKVDEIMTIVETSRRFIDDETALPVQAEGELTDNPNITATATNFMSMSNNITFRRVVKSFDDGVTVPNLRRLYDWNMQQNSRDDIKGDMSVFAQGSTVLLMRELQSAMLMAVAQGWTGHPILGKLVKPYEAAWKALQSMMIDPETLMPTKEQYEAAVAAEAEAAKEQKPPEVLAAEARLQAAQIDAEARVTVAELQRETELMKIAQTLNMKLDELRAHLKVEDSKLASKERIFAAEASLEERREEEARARGEQPRGSGGSL